MVDPIISPVDSGVSPAKPPVASETAAQSALTEVEQLKAQLVDYTDLVKRIQAEFENYQKRIAREQLEAKKLACVPLLLDLLTVQDALDVAIASKNNVPESNDSGLRALSRQFETILHQHGVSPMSVLGKTVDGHLHEVVGFTSDPAQKEGVITVEVRKGYLLHGKLLRPSLVQVNQLVPKINEEKQVVESKINEEKIGLVK